MKYLAALETAGLVRKTKMGRTNFYVNEALFRLLSLHSIEVTSQHATGSD